MQTAGIYIHIPFCRKKCLYCDFYSVANADKHIQSFVDALCSEIRHCDIDTSNWNFDTCFFGGGTPSLLLPHQLESILQTIQTRFSVTQFTELTLEANPGEISEDKLTQYHSLGVNRISLGVQSLNPAELQFLDRLHSSDNVFQTMELIRKAGFDNFSCDLIYGIPGQTDESWINSLKTILDLKPNHISAYELTVEKGTPLYSMVHLGKIQFPSDSSILNKADITHRLLSEYGYERYEISNYAKSGKYCTHNIHYWRIDPYLGFGPSAHSFWNSQRTGNVIDLPSYLNLISKNESVIDFKEDLTEKQVLNEKIGFGLRMKEGFDQETIPNHLYDHFNDILETARVTWQDCLQTINGKVSLTEKGTAFADAIAVDLLL